MGGTSTSLRWTWVESLIVLGAALWILSIVLSPRPYVDEYYHVLAARSLLDNGTLSINGGEPYTRARAYTYAVAACYRWFGESWASGRLPSLLAGGLLVMSVFAWLHRTAGRRAAWLGAAMLVFAPHVLTYSAMIRFYMPHMLFVWLSWVCAYGFIAGQGGRASRLLWLLAGLACALIAAHLQTTTAIAALAVGVWALSVYLGYLMRCDAGQRRKAVVWFGVLLVIAVPVFLVGLKLTGAQELMSEKLNTTRAWTEAHRYEYQYYHRFFNEYYPLLWAVFPVIAVIALATRRRPAWFCLVLFGTAFIVHSLMATKGKRYLSYAWPCFFAVWAIGLDGLLTWLRAQAQAVVGQVFSERTASRRWVGVAIGCFLAAAVLFAALVAPSYKYGRKMLTGEMLGPLATADWFLAAQTLKPIADETGYVVSSSQPKALYHLGRLDLGLSVSQSQGRPEFAVHPKMGRPVITSADSLKRVMSEHPAGLIVIEAGHLGSRFYVPAETALYIQEHLQPIDLADTPGVKAFRWGPVGKTLSGAESP
jgi:4-amino-4-deoxy-L-arabinose transferase-like glycosyltransferase